MEVTDPAVNQRYAAMMERIRGIEKAGLLTVEPIDEDDGEELRWNGKGVSLKN